MFSAGKASFGDSPGLVSSRQSDSNLLVMKFFGKLSVATGCWRVVTASWHQGSRKREMGGLVTNEILFRA